MKRLMNNHKGITLIETVVSIAIIAIIMVTVLGALLYGQKMVVFSDSKNGAAAKAQDIIDDRMNRITSGKVDATVPPNENATIDGYEVEIKYTEVDQDTNKTKEGCNIQVRVYYDNKESYVELMAYALKGGINL